LTNPFFQLHVSGNVTPSEGFTTDDSKSSRKRGRQIQADTAEEVDIINDDPMLGIAPMSPRKVDTRAVKKARRTPDRQSADVSLLTSKPAGTNLPLYRIYLSFLFIYYV
jgi:hypothetical protein